MALIARHPCPSLYHASLYHEDDAKGAERKLMEQMEKDGSAEWNEDLKAAKNGTLKKSERLTELMLVSERLGATKVTTYANAGEREVIDTREHPDYLAGFITPGGRHWEQKYFRPSDSFCQNLKSSNQSAELTPNNGISFWQRV